MICKINVGMLYSFSWHLILKHILPKYVDLIESFYGSAIITDSAQIEFVVTKYFSNALRA